MSAVEVTKSLRDRGKPLNSRIELSKGILEGKCPAIIPRKENVVLDWILDMLAIDTEAKTSINAWNLLRELWSKTPLEGRVRSFKNHRFVSIVTDALKETISQELIEMIVQCSLIISQSITEPAFQFSSDQQASQLLLAYCNSPVAVSNESMSTLIFESLKTRSHIFSKSQESVSILDSLIAENNDERRIHYLKDFLSWPSHIVVPTDIVRIDSVVMAICEIEKQSEIDNKHTHNTDTSEANQVKDHDQRQSSGESQENNLLNKRILDIAMAFPQFISREIEIVSRIYASVLRSNLLQNLLSLSFSARNNNADWSVINLCLQLNPTSIVQSSDIISKILGALDIPAESLAALISKMSDSRNITDLFDKWSPVSSSLPDIVESALMKAFDKLSARQVVNILESKSPTKEGENDNLLRVILKSLSYRCAALQPVAKVLDELFHNENTTDELRAEILNIQPYVNIGKPRKKDNTFVLLRAVELGYAKDPESLVASAAKRFESDEDTNRCVLLRYFPLVEKYLEEHRMRKIIKRTSVKTRCELVSNHDFLECPKLTHTLLEFSISHSEFDVLNDVPKEVFNWNLRHTAIEKLLSEPYPFERIVPFISRLIDSQNPPPTENLTNGLLAKAKPNSTNLLLDLLLVLKSGYLKELLSNSNKIADWQKCCIQGVLAKKDPENNQESAKSCINWIKGNLKSRDFIDGIISILTLIPDVPQASSLPKLIAQEYIGNSAMRFPRALFKLLCHHGYHWSILSAFYVFTGCVFEEDYVEYLKTLKAVEVAQLLYTCADQSQYGVLKALVISKRIADNQQMANVITYSILKATAVLGLVDNSSYWEFCDVMLREQPSLVTQFTLETILGLIASSTVDRTSNEEAENDILVWEKKSLVVSRIFLLKRNSLKKRLHLAINSLSSLLLTIHNPKQALLFYRLVDNLCNPPQFHYKSRGTSQELTSQVAKERRHVGRHIGVLLQNIILTVIARSNTTNTWSELNVHLRAASLLIIDLIYGDGLKAVSAGMDSASRAYLKSLFEYYKIHGRWSSDD